MGVVVVTGGLGALGRAVVSELAAGGHTVAVVDISEPSAPSPAALVLGGVDLADGPKVETALATVGERLGSLDGLVNVAGGFVWEPVAEGALESFDRMYRINLRTAAAASRAALPALVASRGAIVNVGAAAATQPGVGMAAYAASKAGVRALTESLAAELKDRGVRVNAVLPTILDTPTNRA